MGRGTKAFLAGAVLLAAVPALAQYPDGPGREILEKQCSTCHSLEIVVSQRHDAAEWKALVTEMIDRGAEVSDEQVPVIVDYLAANWSKPAEKPAAVEPVPAH